MNHKDIRKVRIANGISQQDFAELIDVPVGTWTNVESGRQPLYKDRRAKAIQVLKELGCDFSVLQKDIEYPRFKHAIKKKEEPVQEQEQPMSQEEPRRGAQVDTSEIDPRFFDVATEIAETLTQKNHDYGDSFYNVYKEFGDLSTFIRLQDKMGRMETLIKGIEARVKDEPLEDVYRDIAGYCILTLVSKQRLQGE